MPHSTDAPLCIDVSVWQGSVDWDAVAAGGVRYAMIKATQSTFTDPRFARNIRGAADAGLTLGVYHYLTATTPEAAQVEALYFLRTIGPFRESIRLWAAVDVEDEGTLSSLPSRELHAVTDAFIAEVEAAGYAPILYTNPNYLTFHYITPPSHPLWLALWRAGDTCPEGYGDVMLWQYGTAFVSGIDVKVDVNRLYCLPPCREEAAEAVLPPEAEESGDNEPSEWARDAVEWAVAGGILYGDGQGNYALREGCTREQVLVFLYRALQGGGRI